MTVKKKILILTIALTAICAIAIFIASIILFVGNLNEAAEHRINFASDLLAREIEQSKSKSYIAATDLTYNNDLKNSIASGNRNEMLRVASDLVVRLDIDFCTITDNTGTIWVRTHEPDNYGDNIGNQENIKSAMSGNTLTVVESGSAVKLSIRTGMPVFDEKNNVIGIISVGFRLDTDAFVDSIKEMTDCEVTIFLGDERVSTTVINAEKKRAVGTKADEKVSKQVLSGTPYLGKAQVVGKSAITKYIPLYGSGSSPIGMAFVGEFTSNDDGKIMTYVFTGLAITLLILAVSIVIAIYISKTIENQLANIIGAVKSAASGISASTGGLASISTNLADGSSRQASSIEETSATMNETASMIAQNAENTRLAAQIAADATGMANKGMDEMRQMTQAMNEIKESSDKVSKIIKTIDDIAFQTNLLAINATVEAARAGGDAGRSFAVVAQEVRNLAQKSAEASKETAQIIEKNITLTNSGQDISNEVSVSLSEITDKTEQLNKLINEINAASEEQSSGVKQINIAISQMEKQTQENAAMAEETTASSNNLQNDALSLNEVVEEASKMIKK